MAVAVRHQKLAYGGDENIGAVRLNAGDQLVVGCLQIGKQLARLAEVELQLPVEGASRESAVVKASARASSSEFASVKAPPARAAPATIYLVAGQPRS